MLKQTLMSTVIALTCAVGASSTVQAAVFKWSFTNVIGGVPGTVSGVLTVPNGTDVAATSVILTQTTNPVFA
ncbi:MAG: hypothetical protein VKN60_03390, partial [Cyanobacteriota bacterium]|nr:hypothetical protein [Cyanobacteriota bacterium]